MGPVDKTFRPFRPFQPDQVLLVPPSLDEWLPQNHLARFVADLVPTRPGMADPEELDGYCLLYQPDADADAANGCGATSGFDL